MINVTDSIKKAYEESTTQYDKIVLDGQEYYINNAQYEDDCYYEGNIFGTAIARTLEFEIEDSIDLEKKEFEYLTGVKTENGIEWINLGNFVTQDLEPNDTTGINKVTAMDYMLKSNIEYTTELNYESGEVTILQVLQEACQEAGLTLATTDFANASFIVDSNQFDEGILIRQVFQAVAQISGTFAKIRNDNKLYFITPKYSGLKVKDIHKMKVKDLNSIPVNKLIGCKNEFKMNDYSELILKRNTHPINLVSLGMSDVEGENVIERDEESIEKDGENSLIINDNPFAYTEEKRHQLISALFDTVKGFEYTAYEITGQAKPYQETGDEVVVIDKDGTFTHSFLFRFNFKSPNGLESEMSAPSITKATIEYQNIESAEQIAKKTELRVDKQEQTITGIITQQTETSEKLTEVEQTIDGITQKVSSVETKVETVENKADTAQSTANEIKSQTIYKVDVMYAISSSSTTAPTTGWQTTAPQWENGKYMWQKTVTTYGDGTQKETSATCITGAKGENGQDGTNGAKGDTGIGVEEIEEQYYLSNSNTTQTGGSWKTTQDTWQKGKYIWTRNKITWTDNTVTYTTPILATGLNNANSMADTANTTANTANNTANQAKDTANNALNEANTAKTQVTTVTNKVTEVEQTVEGITQNVSEVEEKITSVETKADNANNKIDNLSVGARNLLLSTQTQNTEKGNTITGAVKTGEKFLNCDVFRSSNAWASIGFNLKRVIEDNNLKVGDKLTYSIYNKTDDTVARDIALYTSPYSTEGTGSRTIKQFNDVLNTEWTRLVVTFEITETMMTCKETNSLRTRYECTTACTTGKYQYWCAPKLELGTIATDWTPAPEDVEDNLTTNYYTKTETNSQIDQKANQITQTVSETYSTKTETTNAKQEAINSANASTDEKLEGYSTTTEMNSAIIQKANEITQQVDTKYDYLRDAVQTNEIKLQDTVAGQGYVTEFKIKGNTSNFKYLAPSDTLVPSNTLVPLGDHFTIICDKQSRNSMSNEAVQVDVKLSEPLRNVGEIYDELNIIDGKTTVTRRIGVNSDLSLYVLSTEVTEALQDVKLSTFDRDTYIYIKEYTGIAYMAKYIIKNDYSDKFITKMEANSKIEEKADSIELDVNKKLENYSTTTEMEATIKLETDKITESVSNKYATKDELSEEKSERIQTANEITQTVSTKVGNNEIISKINQSAEAVGIDADKISFIGKTIDICNNDGETPILNAYISSNDKTRITITPTRVWLRQNDKTAMWLTSNSNAKGGIGSIDIPNGGILSFYGSGGGTEIDSDGITTPKLTQTSLEELKKNIEKLEEGLEIVKNTDIYKYNLKSEKDTDKKHIGFVIGKDYKYSKEITAVNKEGKETGAEIYSMVAVLYKAMQEVAERVEKLEEVQNEKDNI